MPPKTRSKTNASLRLTAKSADRHILYEQAVQCVEAEIDFVDLWFRKLTGRRATTLREDFCGTANTSCEWVRRRPGNRAVGVDLDEDVLAWGMRHHVRRLSAEQQRRVSLVMDDVRTPGRLARGHDIVLAMNFSYWIFKTRAGLLAYFKSVYASMAKDGVFFLDFFGGYEAGQIITEKKKCPGFTYIWEHAHHNPISGDILCHIHFAFPDGSRMNKAFTYDWRLWTLPEVRELLEEAGFGRVTVYWEGDEKDEDGNTTGEGNGKFTPNTTGEVCAGWIVYLSAEKKPRK
jgi:hypothetical protein